MAKKASESESDIFFCESVGEGGAAFVASVGGFDNGEDAVRSATGGGRSRSGQRSRGLGWRRIRLSRNGGRRGCVRGGNWLDGR